MKQTSSRTEHPSWPLPPSIPPPAKSSRNLTRSPMRRSTKKSPKPPRPSKVSATPRSPIAPAGCPRPAEILEAEKEPIGRLMTLEMGKTLGSAIAEAEKCALGCRYYAEHAAKFIADEVIRDRRFQELYPLPTARHRSRRHALELPFLAGLPLHRSGPDGRQRRPAETLLQRPAMRPEN